MLATEYDNFEVVVVDNGSTDESVAWLSSDSRVKVIALNENRGFCGGNNAALEETTGEFVVLLNNDVEVTPNWLTNLVEPARLDPSVAAAQPKLIDYNNRNCFEYAGAAGGHIDALGYPFARGRIFGTIEDDQGQYDSLSNVFWASGAALLLRRAALDKVGHLDERLFMHMEEIDLCWRLWRAGYSVIACPESVVFHMGGATLSQSNPRKSYFNFRNSLLLLYKHTTPNRWPAKFLKRLALDSLAVIRELVLLNPRAAWAIIRAYRDAHKLKTQFDLDRPGINDKQVEPSFAGSIVLAYFLRRRTRFSDLPSERFRAPFASRTREVPSQR